LTILLLKPLLLPSNKDMHFCSLIGCIGFI